MCCISRVPDQNGISQLYNMLEIYHSGLEPLKYNVHKGVANCNNLSRAIIHQLLMLVKAHVPYSCCINKLFKFHSAVHSLAI